MMTQMDSSPPIRETWATASGVDEKRPTKATAGRCRSVSVLATSEVLRASIALTSCGRVELEGPRAERPNEE